MSTNTLKSKIKNKQYALEEKIRIYNCEQNKLRDLKNLIERNKKSQSEKCLSFPFLIIEPSSRQGTTLDLKMQSNFQKLCINSNHEMKLHGDMEVISMLKNSSSGDIDSLNLT